MRLVRDPKSGELVRIEARGNVVLDWSRITATADELTLDLVAQTCAVGSTDGRAHVALPNGVQVTAAFVEADYAKMSVRSWHGRILSEAGRR